MNDSYDLGPMLNEYKAIVTDQILLNNLGFIEMDEGTEGYFERQRRYARRKRWQNLLRQGQENRRARIQLVINDVVGERHWEWFERGLHDECE